MDLEVDDKGLIDLMGKMEGVSRKTNRKLKHLARDTPHELQRRLVDHASGRPGPNVVTGEYVSKFWTVLLENDEGQMVVLGGNPSPQAARLEYGFFGLDSLGRNYAQPAFPHFRPALIETQRWYLERAAEILREELG